MLVKEKQESIGRMNRFPLLRRVMAPQSSGSGQQLLLRRQLCTVSASTTTTRPFGVWRPAGATLLRSNLGLAASPIARQMSTYRSLASMIASNRFVNPNAAANSGSAAAAAERATAQSAASSSAPPLSAAKLAALEAEVARHPNDIDKLSAYIAESARAGIPPSPDAVRKHLESLQYAAYANHSMTSSATAPRHTAAYAPPPPQYAPPPPQYYHPPPAYGPPQTTMQMAAGATGAGTSPNQPLYTQPVLSRSESVINSVRLFMSLMLFGFLAFTLYNLTSGKPGAGGIGGIAGARGSIAKEANKAGDSGSKVLTRFSDVKGVDEAKKELQEIVAFLKKPERFSALGGKMPRGVLLMGPPGTGKTLLAKAVAGEAGVPFFYCSGSEFEEMYVGVGARRIRDLFETAKKKSPCLIFIDEIDAVGGKRHERDIQGTRMTLNELLTQMDGFGTNDKVVVIAATNFPEALDKALMRPGRFDRHVDVPLPDVKGRKEILELYLKKIPTEADVDLMTLARGTPGCSGAELFNMVNSAAVRCSTKGMTKVNNTELEYAKDKVLMGAERASAIIPEEVRKNTAYHESGHAIMAMFTPGALPIHKATIIQRGRALGVTHMLPEERQTYQRTKREMLANLDVAMGGRVAEEMIFGVENVTSGASNDFAQATGIARDMVLRYGMCDRIGPISVSDEAIERGALSEQKRKIVDEEVSRLINESHARTRAMLAARSDQLHALAGALLKQELLTADEIKAVVNSKKMNHDYVAPVTAADSTTQASASRESPYVVGVDVKAL